MGARRPVAPSQEGAQAPRAPAAFQTPESVTGERLPRRARLRRGSEFVACWEEGRRWRGTHLDFIWRPVLARHARFAVLVPRFQYTAVARNRLRRRLRELIRRETLARLPAVALIVRAHRSAYAASFATLRADLASGVSHVT